MVKQIVNTTIDLFQTSHQSHLSKLDQYSSNILSIFVEIGPNSGTQVRDPHQALEEELPATLPACLSASEACQPACQTLPRIKLRTPSDVGSQQSEPSAAVSSIRGAAETSQARHVSSASHQVDVQTDSGAIAAESAQASRQRLEKSSKQRLEKSN